MTELVAKDVRAAQIAHVLARAVREGGLEEADALRILRHELRAEIRTQLWALQSVGTAPKPVSTSTSPSYRRRTIRRTRCTRTMFAL
jgi:hypothetical protein